MNKIKNVQNKIDSLEAQIFHMKIYINTSYRPIDYNKLYQLTDERNLLKMQLYNLKKQKVRIEKLERINQL